MACPLTNQIIGLASGELPSAEAEQLRAHLADCSACAAEYAALQRTWDTLDAWAVDPGRHDLTGAVLARAADVEQLPQEERVRLLRMPAPLRAAASILVAVGLGLAAGRLIPVSESTQPVQIPESSTQDVVEYLGLNQLASTATGLPEPLLTEPSETGGQDNA